MPTVIDELVVVLGLDPTKFNQEQKSALDNLRRTQEQAVRLGNEIESQGKKTTEFFSSLKREALGLLGVFLAGRGIKEFVGYVTTLDAATSRMAKTMNVSTRELSAWQGAFKQTGGTAESATGALHGMSSEVNRFMLTGQTSLLPVLNSLGIGLFKANGQLKTSTELFLDLASAVKGMDPARASALLSMVPGMNQDSINLLIQGRKAIEEYLKQAREAGGTTEESADAAKEYQQNLALLESTAVSTSRALLTSLMPSLISVMTQMREMIKNPLGGKSFFDYLFSMPKFSLRPGSFLDAVAKGLNSEASVENIKKMWSDIKNSDISTPEMTTARAKLGRGLSSGSSSGGTSALPSVTEREAYIRSAARARGIDPDQAVRVARSEGLGGSYVGDKGTSFGDFQLHYKNNIPGLSNAGLGDKFTKQTGLDARDPTTWRQQVDFSLDEAKKGGWGPWHGWKGLPFTGIGNTPASPGMSGSRSGNMSTTSITINKVEVNTQATDAEGIARDIKPALERATFAASANYGQQ